MKGLSSSANLVITTPYKDNEPKSGNVFIWTHSEPLTILS